VRACRRWWSAQADPRYWYSEGCSIPQSVALGVRRKTIPLWDHRSQERQLLWSWTQRPRSLHLPHRNRHLARGRPCKRQWARLKCAGSRQTWVRRPPRTLNLRKPERFGAQVRGIANPVRGTQDAWSSSGSSQTSVLLSRIRPRGIRQTGSAALCQPIAQIDWFVGLRPRGCSKP